MTTFTRKSISLTLLMGFKSGLRKLNHDDFCRKNEFRDIVDWVQVAAQESSTMMTFAGTVSCVNLDGVDRIQERFQGTPQ